MADQATIDKLTQKVKALEKEIAEQTESAELRHKELRDIIKAVRTLGHDINQPLMAISGYAELLSMEMSEKGPLRDKIDKIIQQADKLSHITHKLMTITKDEAKGSG